MVQSRSQKEGLGWIIARVCLGGIYSVNAPPSGWAGLDGVFMTLQPAQDFAPVRTFAVLHHPHLSSPPLPKTELTDCDLLPF